MVRGTQKKKPKKRVEGVPSGSASATRKECIEKKGSEEGEEVQLRAIPLKGAARMKVEGGS